MLPGEEIPSTIVIHKNLTTEHLILLARWRLVHLDLEHRTRNRFSPSYLRGLRNSEQARARAADASLGNSDPIPPYLDRPHPPQPVNPQPPLSSTPTIPINRPPQPT